MTPVLFASVTSTCDAEVDGTTKCAVFAVEYQPDWRLTALSLFSIWIVYLPGTSCFTVHVPLSAVDA